MSDVRTVGRALQRMKRLTRLTIAMIHCMLAQSSSFATRCPVDGVSQMQWAMVWPGRGTFEAYETRNRVRMASEIRWIPRLRFTNTATLHSRVYWIMTREPSSALWQDSTVMVPSVSTRLNMDSAWLAEDAPFSPTPNHLGLPSCHSSTPPFLLIGVVLAIAVLCPTSSA